MFYMHGAGWGWGWWLLMSIGMIAFWALIIFAIVWLVRGRPTDQREPAPPQPPEQPEEIVKRRLAQGEISLEEYERLQAAMREGPPGPISLRDRQSAA
jgi:putative membrane protein